MKSSQEKSDSAVIHTTPRLTSTVSGEHTEKQNMTYLIHKKTLHQHEK